MSENKKYWKGFQELANDPEFKEQAEKEFTEEIPVDEFLGDKNTLESSSTSRRDFLKYLGFSVTAASLAACEAPVIKSIPYVVKPEDITPGVANWYTSTFFDGNDYCSVLVKTREGRPIHIQGNKLSEVTKGGVNARVNSSVLSLYDTTRLKTPMIGGQPAEWGNVDTEISKGLENIAAAGGNIRILSNTIISPSTKEVIKKFGSKYSTAGFKHVTYDSISHAGMLKANKASFGQAVIPSYHFDKAKVIVSVGADFLANWLMSVQYAKDYATVRNPKNDWMARHFQFEANLSLTGSNADFRSQIKPSQEGLVVANLYNKVAAKLGGNSLSVENIDPKGMISKAADELVANKGKGLVVAGSNNVAVQQIVNALNELLGNYGSTIDKDTPVYIRQSNDDEVVKLIEEMNGGKVDALFVYGVNPVYSLPAGLSEAFKSGLGKVKLGVSFAGSLDETSELVKYVCPDNHYLESWNDFSPVKGQYSTAQPVISQLFKTRQAQVSLLTWAGAENTDYHRFIQKNWESTIFPMQTKYMTARELWNYAVHDGVLKIKGGAQQMESGAGIASEGMADSAESASTGMDISVAAAEVNKIAKNSGAIELQLHESTAMGDGNQANNPWLLELADPITKLTWDNCITMSFADVKQFGYNTELGQQAPASLAKVTVNGVELPPLPVVPQPGQTPGTIGIAVGYGRTTVGKAGKEVGQNAFKLLSFNKFSGTFDYALSDVKVEKVEGEYPVALLQTHHTEMGRSIVKETTFDQYKKDPRSGNPEIMLTDVEGKKMPPSRLDLWEHHDIDRGHRWGMTIDLNSCIGCSACVTACTAENNVPVVGKDEVRRNRDMLWLRIDRYYSSDANPKETWAAEIEEQLKNAEGEEKRELYKKYKELKEKDYTAMEEAGENPDVVFQPVMCQHCNHAPCETVCPVVATTHSNEGLNMMTYNRCVGTRYCANNCPYKVRRFNWFQYDNDVMFDGFNPSQSDLGRMVLNPDVVVRSRGVMEKCSMCVQRIQAGKLDAKKEMRKVKEDDIQTACAAACPTNAIIFGDLNDGGPEGSMAWKNAMDERSYNLLEEVGTRPNIFYQTKVRNRTREEEIAIEKARGPKMEQKAGEEQA